MGLPSSTVTTILSASPRHHPCGHGTPVVAWIFDIEIFEHSRHYERTPADYSQDGE